MSGGADTGGLAAMTRTVKPGRVLACMAPAAALAVPLGMAGHRQRRRSGSPSHAVRRAGRDQPAGPPGHAAGGRPARDGLPVRAAGLSWRPVAAAARGHSCSASRSVTCGRRARPGPVARACTALTGADATVTPFAARRYMAGHADTGKYLKVTETATEVVETDPATFAFSVFRASRSYTAPRTVRRYPYAQRPVSGFLNGLPERQTGSTQEYFQVSPPHYNAANGPASQSYRVDGGPWRPMPGQQGLRDQQARRGQAPRRGAHRRRGPGTRCCPSAGGWSRCPPRWPAPGHTAGPAGTRRTWTAPAIPCAGTGRSAG